MDTIYALLLKLGIHKTYKGTRYLRYALQLCLEDEDCLLRVSSLYAKIAEKFNTTPDNVDNCIHTVITVCWNHGNQKYLIGIAKYDLETRPTNSEFLDILYCHLKSLER